MFMGLLAREIEAWSHVLFAGRRHGDVTPTVGLAHPGGLENIRIEQISGAYWTLPTS